MMKDKNAYTRDYNKANYKAFTFRLHRQQDLPIIRALEESGSPTTLIRRLILQDLESRGINAEAEMLRPRHDDLTGYPFEVLECLPYNDHHIVGYYKTLTQARDALAAYVMERGACGAMRIVTRARCILSDGTAVTAGAQGGLQ